MDALENKPLTMEQKYELLVKAAVNGADNATSPMVDSELETARKRVENNAARAHEKISEEELEIRSRKMVVEKLSNPKGLESGKILDSTGNEVGYGFIQTWIEKDFMSAFMSSFGGKLFATIKEKFVDGSKDSFGEIWNKKDSEIRIAKFAESKNISSDRLMSELANLPEGTIEAAAITPESQAKKAEAIRTAKNEEAKAEENKGQHAANNAAEKERQPARNNGVGGGTPADPADDKYPNVTNGQQANAAGTQRQP